MTNVVYRNKYRILSAKAVSDGIFGLRIDAPEIAFSAAPGQFVNVYLEDNAMLLPRPVCIADASDDALGLAYAVVGGGTKKLSSLKNGDRIELMGPLGTGFFSYPGSPMDEPRTERYAKPFEVLLIGGGSGVPPLYFAAKKLRGKFYEKIRLRAFLGFREAPWFVGEFRGICDEVAVASETEGAAGVCGLVTDLLDKAYPSGIQAGLASAPPALAIACGPRPMLKAVSQWCAAKDIPLRVSLEERMGCGYGACAGCTVKTRPLDDEAKPQNGPGKPDAEGIIRKKVCVHGPVFWSDEVVW